MDKSKLINIGFFSLAFFLPLQTRFIFHQEIIRGFDSEFGTVSVFATQLLIVSLWVAVIMTKRGLMFRYRHRGVHAGVFLLFVISFFSLYFAKDTNIALFSLGQLIAGISLIFLFSIASPPPAVVLKGIFFGAIVQSLFGILQFFSFQIPASSLFGLASHTASTLGDSVVGGNGGRFLRAYGSFPHPNIFGGYLAVSLFAFFPLKEWGKHRSIFSNIALDAGFIIIVIGLVLSFSRSAWLGGAAGFVTSLIIGIFYCQRIFRSIMLWALGIVSMTTVTFFLIFSPLIMSRIVPNGRIEHRSTQSRLRQLKDAEMMIKQHWFTGVGIGNAGSALQDFYPQRKGYDIQPVHNTFLVVWLELGIAGFFVFISLFVATLFRLFFLVKKEQSPLILMSIGQISTLFILMNFDHYFWTLWPGIFLFWFLLGFQLLIMCDKRSMG